MYLKKIEVQGFKSFANKIVFDFHEGITGIVGPNGSGKSNVSDAVRWVLGEQSAKQLRGGNMQDVIFSGTQLRKAQGYACVVITFDNSDHTLLIDFDEVSVSRRIYRSGESEYMINGSPCRLKDVQEIFYDTGIGKDGYSIIGQGQVDKIISGKPEDRRELFDEAAGITKYKRRKNVAIKKLENERNNLIRISDILTELERQVTPLQKQSLTAKEFLRLREELKRYEANNFIFESTKLREKLEELEENEVILNEELENVNFESDSILEKYNQVVIIIEELENELNKKKDSLTQNNRKLGELVGEVKLLNEKLSNDNQATLNANKRVENIDKDIAIKNENEKKYDLEKLSLDKELTAINAKLEVLTKEVEKADENISESERKLENCKSEMMNSISEKSNLKTEEQRLSTLVEQMQIRQSEVYARILQSKADIDSFENKLSLGKEKFQKINEEIKLCEDRLESIKLDSIKIQDEIQIKIKIRNEKRDKYHRLKATKESLRNIAEKYEGYSVSIKKVMEVKDNGVHGVVADLISTQKGYETAIETALGSRIQNIVIDNEDTAKRLIEYLKKNKYGRATFLPISSIGKVDKTNFREVLTEKGVLGLASDLVNTKDEYRSIVNSLIGKIIVVDNITNAIAIEKKYHYEYRIVTIEGESLSPGGAISGGAYKNTANLLGRKRELDELEESFENLKKELEIAENDCNKEKENLSKENDKAEIIKKELQSFNIEKNSKEVELKNLNEQLLLVKETESELNKEIEELNKNRLDFDNEREKLVNKLSGVENMGLDYENDISKLSIKLEEFKAEKEKLRDEVNTLSLSSQAIIQKLEFINENVDRLELEKETLKKEQKELFESLKQCKLDIEEKEKKIELTQKDISFTEREIDKLNAEITQLSEKKEQESISQKKFFDEKNSILEKKSGIEKAIFRLVNQKEKHEEKLGNLTNYMWNEYELTIQTVSKFKEDDILNDDIPKVIEDLKTEIKKLGNVNVNAIDEYREVAERYELMKTQHEDIIEAESQLVKIIEDLDIGMRRKFEEKFKLISEQFDIVFKELFGGGSGKLEIEEDVDLLEASISVISQPPGKKLQNMMQLSGGEKALTAISLLFAIQNLKPSPFALLDEIEAALDDSNVERFAKYLHKLSDRTQFIVITHRKGTMVCADRLYGITMQEKGVSTLVSVNLIGSELN